MTNRCEKCVIVTKMRCRNKRYLCNFNCYSVSSPRLVAIRMKTTTKTPADDARRFVVVVWRVYQQCDLFHKNKPHTRAVTRNVERGEDANGATVSRRKQLHGVRCRRRSASTCADIVFAAFLYAILKRQEGTHSGGIGCCLRNSTNLDVNVNTRFNDDVQFHYGLVLSAI